MSPRRISTGSMTACVTTWTGPSTPSTSSHSGRLVPVAFFHCRLFHIVIKQKMPKTDPLDSLDNAMTTNLTTNKL